MDAHARSTQWQLLSTAALSLVMMPAAVTTAADTGAADSVSGSHEYNLGPFKFGVGPQSDGYFGATLKGDKNYLFSEFSGLASPATAPAAESVAWFSYGNVDLALDSGWSSAPAANNNATVSLKPTVTFGAAHVSPKAHKQLTAEEQTICDQFPDAFEKAVGDAAKQKLVLSAFKKAGCDTFEDPYHDIAAISLYPSFEYRFGHFTQGGQQYQANQAVVGAGARVFFPWQLNGWWASWPFVSATYYHVKNSSGSTVPVPDGIKADYISGEGKIDVLLPVKLRSTPKALELSIDITGSKATSGSDQSWKYLKNIQLLANVGGTWKPAVTYRSGQDRGLAYDKQVILGVVAELF